MWKEKVLEYENQMIEDLKGLLSIESIRDDSKATADAPVGPGPREALDYMYNLGKRDGFSTHDVDHIAGRIEAGKGEDVLGISCRCSTRRRWVGFKPIPTSSDRQCNYSQRDTG